MKIHGCLEYFLVSFWVSAYLQMLLTLTPRKINMEHNHGGLVPIIFHCKWVICSFQPFIFQGVVFGPIGSTTGALSSLQVPETGRSVALHIKPKLKPQAPCVLCWKTRGKSSFKKVGDVYLPGGFSPTNPSEKYARVKLDLGVKIPTNI